MWYFIQRRGIKPPEEWTVSLDQHLVWMKQQHEAGRILFSGPSPDRKVGMYVIRAESREEAERIAKSDPFTQAGLCTFDLIEWNVRQIMGVGPFTEAELQRSR
jgi:uncharacterized protein YciI